jgi:hypothetical protein
MQWFRHLSFSVFWFSFFLSFFLTLRNLGEGVGTSKIRTSKGQNVESFFKDDQNVERSERRKFEKDQNVESQIRLSTF